jgi:hypothetical protein
MALRSACAASNSSVTFVWPLRVEMKRRNAAIGPGARIGSVPEERSHDLYVPVLACNVKERFAFTIHLRDARAQQLCHAVGISESTPQEDIRVAAPFDHAPGRGAAARSITRDHAQRRPAVLV